MRRIGKHALVILQRHGVAKHHADVLIRVEWIPCDQRDNSEKVIAVIFNGDRGPRCAHPIGFRAIEITRRVDRCAAGEHGEQKSAERATRREGFFHCGRPVVFSGFTKTAESWISLYQTIPSVFPI